METIENFTFFILLALLVSQMVGGDKHVYKKQEEWLKLSPGYVGIGVG